MQGTIKKIQQLHASALEASTEGNHRLALATLSEAASLWHQLKKQSSNKNDDSALCGQLERWNETFLKDQKKLTEAVYGVKSSDGRVSLWQHHLATSRKNYLYPPHILFYAWARHQDTIYRIGGDEFPLGTFNYKELDLVWAFDIPARTWRRVDTRGGKSPGMRAQHGAFVHKNGLYVMGGLYMDRQLDMKLYRLDLNSFVWELVKIKGSPPPGRCSFALCQYRNKIFLHGGRSESTDEYFADIWCLDVGKSKPEWRQLTSGAPGVAKPRKSHCIFTDGNVLYVFGGLTCPKGKNEIKFRRTIKAFEAFNLQEKKWRRLACVGDDPWDMAEICALTLYEGQKDPQSVLIWGGYREGGENVVDNSDFDEKLDLTDEKQREYGLPYRRRLLNFSFTTKSWRLLVPTRNDLAPTAQAVAAELSTSSDSNVTRVMIVGGYGLNYNSSKDDDDGSTSMLRMMKALNFIEDTIPDDADDNMMTPKIKRDVLEVQLLNGGAPCFADRVAKRSGWEWEFFKEASSKLPQINLFLNIGSPMLHWVPNVAEDDFRAPSSDSIVDNDESRMLGRQVVFRDLKGRQDLNGKTGRCGPWLSERGRYVANVFSDQGGSSSVIVKSANLKFPARALECQQMVDKILNGTPFASTEIAPVNVHGIWATFAFDTEHCPLDPPPECDTSGGKRFSTCSDSYHGPLSAKAMAVLPYAGDTVPGARRAYGLLTMRMKKAETQTQKDRKAKTDYYLKFVRELRETDGRRVTAWQKDLIDSRDQSAWDQWLSIKVSLDGAAPTVERELLVSSNMTLEELHHQVLTPTLGWQNNLHAYAFRSKHVPSPPPSGSDIEERGSCWTEQNRLVLDALEKECWIGPTRSTALDLYFQPLYIGGAVANDREIFLGDLFFPKSKEVCHLQYVHDFGAWWSHTIEIRCPTSKVPDNSPPATLLTARMACPPDDIQGIQELAEKARKLAGVGIDSFDPSTAEWWELLNTDWRSKQNYYHGFDPFKLDIKRYRENLKKALLLPVPKRGRESRSLAMRNLQSGLSGSAAGPGSDTQQVQRRPTDPTKYCAVCNVTAALSVCAGCRSVAFCGREHQLQFWPEHKAACKASQRTKTKSNA